MARPTAPDNPSWMRRIGWLLLIWMLSVVALGVAAAFFRLFMKLAGLTV